MKINQPGILQEGFYQNWKYLYYSKQPNSCFEEIINFYTTDLTKDNFKISKYRYFGQQKWLKNRFWDHWDLSPINSAQPHIDVIVNIMLTDSNNKILSGVYPNLIKLSDSGFTSSTTQFNTNYLIFLDTDLIVEQYHLYEKYKNEISNYLINNKDNVLNNFNNVLKNYKKK